MATISFISRSGTALQCRVKTTASWLVKISEMKEGGVVTRFDNEGGCARCIAGDGGDDEFASSEARDGEAAEVARCAHDSDVFYLRWRYYFLILQIRVFDCLCFL